MNKIKIIAIAFVFVVIGGLATFAQKTPVMESNIGFIDEVAVVKNYPQAKTLDLKQKKLTLELQKFAADARFQIASAKTPEEKKHLEETLSNQLNEKKKSLDEEYIKMFSALQKDVLVAVQSTAQRKNLTVVLRRDSVIYGGTDITQDVINSLNKK